MSISIHALLAESDFTGPPLKTSTVLFLSTLSLRRATACVGGIVDNVGFLSTLSLRRATPRCYDHRPHLGYFYPRSPCGERRISRVKRLLPSWISIHALLAESD